MAGRTGILARIMEAQERRARPFVNEALSKLDDASLAGMGLDPEEVRRRPRRPFF
jgi:hypothetical protein